MNPQPLPPQDPFAAIPAVPVSTPPHADALPAVEPPVQPAVHPQPQQQAKPAPTVHEIDLFAPPTAEPTPSPVPHTPQAIQPTEAAYWPQPTLTPEDHETLFGRERLTKTHKIIIAIVTIVVLGVLIGGGAWMYFSLIAPSTTPPTDTSNTVNNSTPTPNVTPPVQNSNASTVDTDNDGLTDDAERRLGTNPRNPDTDGDSYTDGDEVENGYSPLE